jgi:hypothetical protein
MDEETRKLLQDIRVMLVDHREKLQEAGYYFADDDARGMIRRIDDALDEGEE